MANRKQSRQRYPHFGYRIALLAAVCFVLPQVVIANSLLHHFYIYGAPLYDAGWFAYWMTHALTLDVTSIPSIEDVPMPMLGRHVFLFFLPLSWIYQIFSWFLSEQIYFSIVQGAWAGMVSLAVFLIGYRAMNCWLLAVVSVATGLNPFVFTSTSFPHVEMAMPAFIALFIASWIRLREHRRLWWMPFLPLAGLLSVREDAGLQGACLFILLTAYFWWRVRERRDLCRFFGLVSLVCIGYSVVAFLVRQSFSAGDDTIVWKFVGSPPYAHLTFDLIWERLAFIASNREYVYIPMLALALLAVLQRSLLPLIAAVSVLPWMLWHLIAKDPLAGTFFPYTMAPVMVVMFWPLSSALLRKMTQEPDAARKHSDRQGESTPPKFWSKITAQFDRRHILIAALLQLVLCVSLTATLTGNDNVRKMVVRDGFSFSYMDKIAPVDHATDIVHRLIVDNAMGEFIMDEAMASLILTDVRPHNVLSHEYSKFQYFDAAESAITFSSGFQPYFQHVNDRFVYHYPQADIYIVSKNAIVALDDTPFELQKLSEDGRDSAAFKAGWLGTNLGPLSIGQSSSVLVDANSDATLCFAVLAPLHPPEHPLEVAISYAGVPTQSLQLDNKTRKDACISMSELSGDVRVRFSVANPHQSKDEFNGGGLSITDIAWRE